MATATKTQHSPNCSRVFKNYDPNCPRCQELAGGAAPRQWRGSRAHQEDMRRVEAIRKHDCVKSGCGPVCTFGDW